MKKHIISVALSVVLITLAELSGFVNPIHVFTNEFYLQICQAIPKQGVSNEIFIVNISDFPLEAIKDQVEILTYYEPKVIAVDYFQVDPPQLGLDTAIDFKNLVLPMIFDDTSEFSTIITRKSHNPFTDSAHYGLVTIEGLVDFAPFTSEMDEKYPLLPTEVIRLYDTIMYKQLLKKDTSKWIINYLGNTCQFNYLGDLLTSTPESLKPIKGKIVLVGYTGKSGIPMTSDDMDVFETPKSLMYGVVILANILHTMMGNQIEKVPIMIDLVVMAFLVILNCVLIRPNQKFLILTYFKVKALQLVELALVFGLSASLFLQFHKYIDYELICLSILVVPEVFFWVNQSIRELR